MNANELKQIVHEYLKSRMEDGVVIQQTWAVNGLLQRMGEAEGHSSEFYTLCAREHLYRVVKQAIGRYDKEVDEEQPYLPGHKELRTHYSFERNGERALVPAYECTPEEVLTRGRQFIAQGKTLVAHGEELIKFADELRRLQAQRGAC